MFIRYRSWNNKYRKHTIVNSKFNVQKHEFGVNFKLLLLVHCLMSLVLESLKSL